MRCGRYSGRMIGDVGPRGTEASPPAPLLASRVGSSGAIGTLGRGPGEGMLLAAASPLSCGVDRELLLRGQLAFAPHERG